MSKYNLMSKNEDGMEIKSSHVNPNQKIKSSIKKDDKGKPKKISYFKAFLFTILAFGGIGLLIWIIGTSIPVPTISNIQSISAEGNNITIMTPSGNTFISASSFNIVSTSFTGLPGQVRISINVTGWFGQGHVLTGTIIQNIANDGVPGEVGWLLLIGETTIDTNNGNFYNFGPPPPTNPSTNPNPPAWNIDPTSSESSFSDSLRNLASNLRPETAPTNFFLIFIQLLPILFLIIFGIIIYRSYKNTSGAGTGGSSIFSVGKSGAKLVKSDIRFKDVAGITEEKAELLEVVDYLKNPAKYVAMGARNPRGVILYGPPGTGKTLLAKAVAGEASVPFFFMAGSGFEDMLVGVGAKRVRDLFKKASEAAPSIIFIDEIDSVASKRSKFDVSSGIGDQTINQLLAEMDGFSTNTSVVVIAATNRLDSLDDAILRPGRFDRQVQINLPDIKERVEILKIHAKNKNISSMVDLNDIGRRTPGFSGAQLENVLNEAAILAVRENKNVISLKMIDEAVDRVIAGPAKKSRVISEEERKLVAFHEAGHAIVGLYTPGSDIVEKITIVPRGRAGGYTVSSPRKQEISIQKKSDLLGIIRMTLGGRAAEETIYGKMGITTGASNDLYKVTNIVRAMVMQMGMSSSLGMTQFIPSEGVDSRTGFKKLYSNETSMKIDIEIDKIINTEYQNALKIIQENKKELDLIVETLLAIETITRPEIEFIHKYKKIPQVVIDQRNELQKKVIVNSTNKN